MAGLGVTDRGARVSGLADVIDFPHPADKPTAAIVTLFSPFARFDHPAGPVDTGAIQGRLLPDDYPGAVFATPLPAAGPRPPGMC